MFGIGEAIHLFRKYEVGKDMVNLFFVISGFIITHVLLKEEKVSGDISLRHFYIKRFLRIWPLYFFILIAVFLVGHFTTVYDNIIGQTEWKVSFDVLTGKSVLMMALFLVNFNFLFLQPLSVLPHYWSLSVEEQFYILWPPLFRRRNPFKPLLIITFGTIGLKFLADYMIYHGGNKTLWFNVYSFFILLASVLLQ